MSFIKIVATVNFVIIIKSSIWSGKLKIIIIMFDVLLLIFHL